MIDELWKKFNSDKYQTVIYKDDLNGKNGLTRIGGQVFETSVPERHVSITNKIDINQKDN